MDARTQSGALYKTTTITTQKKRFEEIYNENLRVNTNCTIISTWTRLPLQALQIRVRINVDSFCRRANTNIESITKDMCVIGILRNEKGEQIH